MLRRISPQIVCTRFPLPVTVSRSTDTGISVCTKAIPQPISTPTAFGITTPSQAITPPIGIPFPACASGISATHLCMKGKRERFSTCSTQSSSSASTEVFHILIGIAPLLFTTNISDNSFLMLIVLRYVQSITPPLEKII